MATFTDTNGASITGDTYLWMGKPTLNKSASTTLVCAGDSATPANLQRRFILRWDLSSSGISGTINTAKITFEVFRGLSTARSIEAKYIMPSRDGMDWTNTNWTNWKALNPWVGGGASSPTDSASYSPKILLNGPTVSGSWDYTGLAFAVQNAIDADSGILRLMFLPYLWGVTTTDKFSVRSVDWTTASQRPTLVVDYTPVTGIMPQLQSVNLGNDLYNGTLL